MILLIDNYDSFSYNLYQMVGEMEPDIRVIRNDERTVEEIRISQEGARIEITYTGSGFLYHMVRILTGTLVETGLGIRSPESIKKVLESKDRAYAGRLMPPEGLMLMEVEYKNGQD